MSKVYKTNVIRGLEHLSSYDFQKNAWFENNLGLLSSYMEDVESVFDDTGLEYALDNDQVVFGHVADNALRELSILLDSIGYDKNEEELIDSPEMQLVRDKAAKALALIQASDYSESTVDIVE